MRDLQGLWDDLARRHKGTPGQTKPSGFQLFNRVADELAQTLPQIAAEALCELEQLQGSVSVSPAICTRCGTGNLEHFYTSKEEGDTLCATCFQERKAGPEDLPEALPRGADRMTGPFPTSGSGRGRCRKGKKY